MYDLRAVTLVVVRGTQLLTGLPRGHQGIDQLQESMGERDDGLCAGIRRTRRLYKAARKVFLVWVTAPAAR